MRLLEPLLKQLKALRAGLVVAQEQLRIQITVMQLEQALDQQLLVHWEQDPQAQHKWLQGRPLNLEIAWE